MFAGVLLVTGAATTLSAWGTFMGVLEHNRHLQEGLNVAHTTVEQLLALPRAHPRLGGLTAVVDAFGQPNAAGPYSVNVVATRNTPARGFVQLDVTVSWSETRGRRDVALVVYRTE